MAKVAINGLGRIGRATLKIIQDTPELELVAVNDIISADNIVYLLRYDTAYGRYDKPVHTEGNNLVIGDHSIRLFSEKDPGQLPWKDLQIDVVFECTGVFTKREDLEKHIRAGAKNVLLSAPAKSEDVVTVVHGVNTVDGNTHIIACASCTTNCITPVIEIMGRRIGIKKAIMTTVHAYTASQSLVDGPSKRYERGRAGGANFVPTSTGAAIATTKALPQYKGLFDGIAVRGPVPIGSVADIVIVTSRPTSGSFGMLTAISGICYWSGELVGECKPPIHREHVAAAGFVGGERSVCRPIQKAWDPSSNPWQPLLTKR